MKKENNFVTSSSSDVDKDDDEDSPARKLLEKELMFLPSRLVKSMKNTRKNNVMYQKQLYNTDSEDFAL